MSQKVSHIGPTCVKVQFRPKHQRMEDRGIVSLILSACYTSSLVLQNTPPFGVCVFLPPMLVTFHER